MNKIYLVVSNRGQYEDYQEFNEKAFVSKKKAEEYAKKLDKEHISKPDFVTDSFEDDYFSCEEDLPDWPDYDKTLESYEEYQKRYSAIDKEVMCELMNKLGYNITPKMCDQFEEYLSNKMDDWYPCTIEEIELCE